MDQYTFVLYVAGSSDLAARALANFERVIRSRLGTRCTLNTVDVVQEPRRAREDRVVATPLLVRLSPHPVIKILGDLSHDEKVINQLGLNALTGTDGQAPEGAK